MEPFFLQIACDKSLTTANFKDLRLHPISRAKIGDHVRTYLGWESSTNVLVWILWRNIVVTLLHGYFRKDWKHFLWSILKIFRLLLLFELCPEICTSLRHAHTFTNGDLLGLWGDTSHRILCELILMVLDK